MAFFKKSPKEDVKKVAKKAVDVDVSKKKTSSATRGSSIILGPVVTEKSAHLSDLGATLLWVDRRANKIQIAQEIKAIYGIIPKKVATINLRGKRVSFGRVAGKRASSKKAIITLPKGKTLDIFEGV